MPASKDKDETDSKNDFPAINYNCTLLPPQKKQEKQQTKFLKRIDLKIKSITQN